MVFVTASISTQTSASLYVGMREFSRKKLVIFSPRFLLSHNFRASFTAFMICTSVAFDFPSTLSTSCVCGCLICSAIQCCCLMPLGLSFHSYHISSSVTGRIFIILPQSLHVGSIRTVSLLIHDHNELYVVSSAGHVCPR